MNQNEKQFSIAGVRPKYILKQFSISILAAVFLLFFTSVLKATTYYVDNHHAAANDTNLGTVERPFLSVQKAVNVAVSGDAIMVKDGIYNERVTTKASGTIDKPILIQGFAKPTIRSFVITNNYIMVSGFNLEGMPDYKAGKVNPSRGYIELQNVEGCQVTSNHVNNTILFAYGVYCTGRVKNAIVKGNTFYRVNSINLVLTGENNLVEDNVFNYTFYSAIKVSGKSHIIRRNYFTLINEGGCGDPAILNEDCDENEECSNILFEINYIKTCHAKPILLLQKKKNPKLGDFIIRNNVFEDVTYSARVCVPRVKYIDNVFINTSRDKEHAITFFEGGNDGEVKGNIFVGCGYEWNNSAFGWYYADPKVTGMVADHNWVSGPYPDYSGKEGFKEKSGRTGGNPFVELDKSSFYPEWKGAEFKPILNESRPKQARNEPDLAKLSKGAKVDLLGSWLEIMDMVNPDIITSKFSKRYKYDSFDNPKLNELRKRYKLDAVVQDGKDEFEKMILLRTLVSKMFKYSPPSIVSDNALEILAELKNGGAFFCVQCADVYLSCCYSLGWTARLFDLADITVEGGHTTTDVWSNQLRKWIVMDPTHNVHYVRKNDSSGMPLNAYEVRESYIKSKGNDINALFGIGRKETKPSVFKYVNVIYIGNGDLLTSVKDFSDNTFSIRDDVNKDCDWTKRESPKEIPEIYWTLGEAKMAIYGVARGKLEVNFTTQTPNFDTFVVKHDEGNWQNSGDQLVWELKPGINKLTATAKNKFGVTGPENYVIIGYK